jgi:transcriptional regulator with XRE-family HTH domain
VRLTLLRSLREQCGLSTNELSRRSGVSAATIRRLENGREARITTAVRLAHALEVEWRDLVGDSLDLSTPERLLPRE